MYLSTLSRSRLKQQEVQLRTGTERGTYPPLQRAYITIPTNIMTGTLDVQGIFQGSQIRASGSFIGNLIGNVTGNLTGNVTSNYLKLGSGIVLNQISTHYQHGINYLKFDTNQGAYFVEAGAGAAVPPPTAVVFPATPRPTNVPPTPTPTPSRTPTPTPSTAPGPTPTPIPTGTPGPTPTPTRTPTPTPTRTPTPTPTRTSTPMPTKTPVPTPTPTPNPGIGRTLKAGDLIKFFNTPTGSRAKNIIYEVSSIAAIDSRIVSFKTTAADGRTTVNAIMIDRDVTKNVTQILKVNAAGNDITPSDRKWFVISANTLSTALPQIMYNTVWN